MLKEILDQMYGGCIYYFLFKKKEKKRRRPVWKAIRQTKRHERTGPQINQAWTDAI
jgi:hypothetical protein